MHPPWPALALGLFVCFGGCAAAPPAATTIAATATVEFVAYLCADACRVELGASDPLPYHAGAPASRRGDGAYEIRYEQRADGRWSPRADGRLLAKPCGQELPAVNFVAAGGLTGCRAPQAEIAVVVETTQRGPAATIRVRGVDAPSLRAHLHRAIAFADGLAAAPPP